MEKMIAAHSIADLKFDEEYLYTASYDNSAAVWSFATESMYCLYAGHINGVMSIDDTFTFQEFKCWSTI
jgi:WD40 repeat protein